MRISKLIAFYYFFFLYSSRSILPHRLLFFLQPPHGRLCNGEKGSLREGKTVYIYEAYRSPSPNRKVKPTKSLFFLTRNKALFIIFRPPSVLHTCFRVLLKDLKVKKK